MLRGSGSEETISALKIGLILFYTSFFTRKIEFTSQYYKKVNLTPKLPFCPLPSVVHQYNYWGMTLPCLSISTSKKMVINCWPVVGSLSLSKSAFKHSLAFPVFDFLQCHFLFGFCPFTEFSQGLIFKVSAGALAP